MAKDPDDPDDVDVRVSVLALPDAPRQPWSRPSRPSRWTVSRHAVRSRHLRGARPVWVYLPPGRPPRARPRHLIIAFDGIAYQSAVPAPRIVENLVTAGRVPPSVLVLVGNAPDQRESELAHNPRFADFLAQELLAWLDSAFGIRASPSSTVLAGSSLGGLAAAYAALRYPDQFGNVLAQSGDFLWSAPGDPFRAPALMREYAVAPRGPTRFYLDAGTFETTVFPGMPISVRTGVRYLRDVLVARGYPVVHAEFVGGHDYACWSGTFADGLIALLGRWRADLPTGTRGSRQPDGT